MPGTKPKKAKTKPKTKRTSATKSKALSTKKAPKPIRSKSPSTQSLSTRRASSKLKQKVEDVHRFIEENTTLKKRVISFTLTDKNAEDALKWAREHHRVQCRSTSPTLTYSFTHINFDLTSVGVKCSCGAEHHLSNQPTVVTAPASILSAGSPFAAFSARAAAKDRSATKAGSEKPLPEKAASR